jgi:hypothetical protein
MMGIVIALCKGFFSLAIGYVIGKLSMEFLDCLDKEK